jgi:hypothetical protein
VPLQLDSLNDDDVFVLDDGLKLYQWNGHTAHPAEKVSVSSHCFVVFVTFFVFDDCLILYQWNGHTAHPAEQVSNAYLSLTFLLLFAVVVGILFTVSCLMIA